MNRMNRLMSLSSEKKSPRSSANSPQQSPMEGVSEGDDANTNNNTNSDNNKDQNISYELNQSNHSSNNDNNSNNMGLLSTPITTNTEKNENEDISVDVLSSLIRSYSLSTSEKKRLQTPNEANQMKPTIFTNVTCTSTKDINIQFENTQIDEIEQQKDLSLNNIKQSKIVESNMDLTSSTALNNNNNNNNNNSNNNNKQYEQPYQQHPLKSSVKGEDRDNYQCLLS